MKLITFNFLVNSKIKRKKKSKWKGDKFDHDREFILIICLSLIFIRLF